MSAEPLRAMIREILAEEVARARGEGLIGTERKPKPVVREERIVIRGDADLGAFVRRLAEILKDGRSREDIEHGLWVFRLAEGVRQAVAAWGMKLCAAQRKWHSDTVSAIEVPDGIDANNVLKTAFYRYNTSLGTGLNKLNGKVFRIGHLGALDEFMVGGVLFAVEMTLKDVGVNFKLGSGTGAAAEYFSKTATRSATSVTPAKAA